MSALDRYLRIIRKYEPLTREEERVAFKKAKAGDTTAYDLIINSNLRFVVTIAKHYLGKGLNLEELIQEGNIGLLKAYERFDLNKNCKFITYAVWWIRQTILNAVHAYATTIRLPVNKINDIQKAQKLSQESEHIMPVSIPLDTLLPYIDYPANIDDGFKFHYKYVDIDKPRTDNLRTLHDILTTTVDYDEYTEPLSTQLHKLLNTLKPKERYIIKMYFGITPDKTPSTLENIGRDLNLTRERVRQIKNASLAKLRQHPDIHLLKEYLT